MFSLGFERICTGTIPQGSVRVMLERRNGVFPFGAMAKDMGCLKSFRSGTYTGQLPQRCAVIVLKAIGSLQTLVEHGNESANDDVSPIINT